MSEQTDPQTAAALRDQIASALYEREAPHGPAWADAHAMDREVFEAMADAVLTVILPTGRFLGDQLRDGWTEAAKAQGQIERVRKVLDERRTEVAEREADGMLPFGTPGAAWCDAVTVTCARVEDALRTSAEPKAVPAHDTGPSVAEAAADDRAHWTQKYAGDQP